MGRTKKGDDMSGASPVTQLTQQEYRYGFVTDIEMEALSCLA